MKNKAHHPLAEVFTRVGCYESTLDTIQSACELAFRQSLIKKQPRDVLQKLDGFHDFFADLAKALARNRGGKISILFEPMGTNEAWIQEYNGSVVLPPPPRKIIKKQKPRKRATGVNEGVGKQTIALPPSPHSQKAIETNLIRKTKASRIKTLPGQKDLFQEDAV